MANIKDIAELAGVSIATVSRTLREPEKVRPATAEKVNKAIDALSYNTNLLASNLRKQRSDAVIVAVPDINNPFTSGFVQGIENVARENRIRVMLGITEGKQELLDWHYAMVAGKQADGMIILDTNIPANVLKKAESGEPQPVILACEYEQGVPLPRVRFDNIEAAALAATHIAKQGHRKIACVTGSPRLQMSQDRQKGFRLGLKRNGLEINERLFVTGGYTLESGAQAAETLLASGEKFSAILCENDEMALGVIHVLAEAGIKVPDDVSVTGMDNLRFGEYANPALTTVSLPSTKIGEQTMRMMLDFYIDAESSVREVILPHDIIVRKSTAAYKQNE